MIKKLNSLLLILILYPAISFASSNNEDNIAKEDVIVIEHKFGQTELSGDLKRVISVGYSEQDTLLALGIIPVGIRDWYGDMPNAIWPWAKEAFGDNTVEILSPAELDYEQIALLEPDVIVGISSGMSEKEYNLLSEIAPVIAQSGDYIDYGTPWQEETKRLGRVFGKEDLAEELVKELEDQFTQIKNNISHYGPLEGTVAFVWEGKPGAYASQDNRSRLLERIGISVPKEYDEIAGDSFYLTFSDERLDLLDTDIILWLGTAGNGPDPVRELELRTQLTAVAEGRELFLKDTLAGAFSFSTPLSLKFLIKELGPALELALDGDPETLVPESLR